MKAFVIKRELTNYRKFVELVENQNPPPPNLEYHYSLYAICRGFKTYDLDGLKVGQEIKLFSNYDGKTQADTDAENLLVFQNGLSLKIDLAWVKNGLIEKIQPTIYILQNDKWMNAQGFYVDKLIPDTENEGEFIDNPEAVLTECDFWLNLMVNVDINDEALIEQGFERLDLVHHYWANVAL